jgi:pimeloyl-ACP methyl ester carboxylesterase
MLIKQTAVAALALSTLVISSPAEASTTRYLAVGAGQIAYDDSGGTGPLVICAPGLGDLREQYRFLAPLLVRAGFRVVTMDLRGMGESSVGWPDYSAAALGDDIVAMINHLGARRAFLVGNSMTGASAVWAAAAAPDRVAGIVLIDPFVRDIPTNIGVRMMLAAAMHRPWGPSFWTRYYGSLYKAAPPFDLADYKTALKANLKEPGRFEALQQMVDAPKASCEARIRDVHAPALIVMGSADPDFSDPKVEADFVTSQLHGQELMVPGAGHYPHVEMPEMVAESIVAFLKQTSDGN